DTAPGTGPADELDAPCPIDVLAQRLGTAHIHAGLLEVEAHQMGGDARLAQAPEEMLGHGQGLASLAFDLANDGVGTRIDDAILTTGHIVLEHKQDIAIVQGVQVLGLAGIDLFAGAHRFTPTRLSPAACWKYRK